MKLSILIPVYNEENTILEVLKRLDSVSIKDFTKEIIVIDDGSSDKTPDKILNSEFNKSIKYIKHQINKGKGMAIHSGIKAASGHYVLIQDADLEYNPKDINTLLEPIRNNESKVVYGTRLNRWPNLKKDEKTFQFLVHYLGNRFLSLLTTILYGQWITDMETGYKLFPKSALKKFNLKAKGFDFEPEITSKLLKRGYKIKEVSINTNPRGYNEGKKLNTIRDGILALLSLLKYRFID